MVVSYSSEHNNYGHSPEHGRLVNRLLKRWQTLRRKVLALSRFMLC